MTPQSSAATPSFPSDETEGLTHSPLPALRTQNLDFYYGNRKVLDSISLPIYPNKVTAIIGPSGCGKSTFLKVFNRIGELEGKVKVTGQVEFFGHNIYDRHINLNYLRQQIGMVFQRPNPFPISIYENVAYGVRLARLIGRSQLDEIVEKALVQAALWDEVKDHLRKSALGLSGGQQQRLCIARALAIEPKVLLMDEPCSALDPISTAKIEELLVGLGQRLTIVIVTHNMQQAVRVSNYTAFFSTNETTIGQLIEFDETARIFMSATDSRTRDYVEGRFG